MSDDAVDKKNKTNGPTIRWDDSKMRSVYANVCNVSSTREEVTLLFGTNQAWRAGQQEVSIELTDRVIVSPFAAKRLALLLNGVVGEYEKRFGTLDETAAK
tara:strand:+ start:4992 stop:5294 length:303 start_codon:yes stop_codon:yes gene_type:complete